MSQDDERIARKLLDLTSRGDRVQIRNGMTYLDGFALGNGTVEISRQVVRDRRMRMRTQDEAVAAPALFSLWEGPDGYYVVNSAGVPTLAAPYSDDASPFGIFNNGFTATGTNDWRYGAVGLRGDSITWNVLFYGPSGLVSSQVTASGVSPGNGPFYRSGLLTNAIDQNAGVRQRYWYTQTASGTDGINTFPNIPEIYALPDQKGSDESGTVWYANSDLTWAVCSGTLLKADGTIIPITSGEPDPWPNIGTNFQSACFVGLTLFVFAWPPAAPSVTFTPYHYKPDTGTVVKGADIVMPYATPGAGYTLRYLSYWSPTP
jgi:hypothetical protein